MEEGAAGRDRAVSPYSAALAAGASAALAEALPPSAAALSPPAAGAASAAGSGRFEPWVFSQAIRLARSAGLPRPAKVILVPGADSRGLETGRSSWRGRGGQVGSIMGG